MARAEEKQAFTSTYSPMREHEQGGNHDFEEDVATSSGCCCCFVGVEGWKTSDQESKYLLQENANGHEQSKETWVVNKLKKSKKFSEVVAGPKWKNMARKIGKHFNPKKSRIQGMAYSPQSYALNFDDGGIVSNTLRPPVPESCDPDWKSLMGRCWSSEPSERPSFTEIANELRSMAVKLPPKGQNQQPLSSRQPQVKS